jgi:hypothetical protein
MTILENILVIVRIKSVPCSSETRMETDDDSIEMYAESLRNREDHQLTTELSKSYSRLKILNEEERIDPEGSEDRERVLDELATIKRKIGALEEEIGRRKKNDAWSW